MKRIKLRSMGGSSKTATSVVLLREATDARRCSTNFTYILDDEGKPVPEPDVLRWADWIERSNKRVLRQNRLAGGVLVTIFVGVDHDLLRRGPPMVWETMILGGRHDGYCVRHATRKEALSGHVTALRIAGKVSGRKRARNRRRARSRTSAKQARRSIG
jgi:hypothetical protein